MYVSVSERFIECVNFLLESRQLRNQAELVAILGKSKGYVSQILSGKKEPSGAVVECLCKHFPDISQEWILTGEGEMRRKDHVVLTNLFERADNTVPLLPIFAQAGHLTGWSESVTEVECERVISPVKDISDLAELTWKDVRNGRVYYRRNKTGRLFSIRIEPEAQAIINRWKGEEHLLAVFDRYKKPSEYNRRLRDALQRLSDKSGQLIEPDCTSNWARHTWATIAADLDYTEEALSWGMGHKTGHRVTEIYIHRSDAKCDEANRAVIDYLWGKETVPRLTT